MATLEVNWPKNTEDGKWLLYLVAINSTGVERLECTPKMEVDPLKLVSESSHQCASVRDRDQEMGFYIH